MMDREVVVVPRSMREVRVLLGATSVRMHGETVTVTAGPDNDPHAFPHDDPHDPPQTDGIN
jgi:hypothetical protein